jgi:hypothetical protein
MKNPPVVSNQASGHESGGKRPDYNAKQQGEVAESAFLHKAQSLGFSVSKPWGDSEPYDFIVDSGADRWRVQIKSTTSCREGRYFVHVCAARHNRAHLGTRSVLYTLRDIDILVAYIVPRDTWFIFPIQALGNRTQVWLDPEPGRSHSLSAKYREAWCLMACPRNAIRRKNIQSDTCCHLGARRPTETACPLTTALLNHAATPTAK